MPAEGKIVRDRIPEIIAASGGMPVVEVLGAEAPAPRWSPSSRRRARS